MNLISFAFLLAGSWMLAKGFIITNIEKETRGYWSKGNPFLQKAKIKQKYEAYAGLFLFVLGTLIQIYINNPDYLEIFFAVVCPFLILIALSMFISYLLFRKEFIPMLKSRENEYYEDHKNIILGDGLYERERNPQTTKPSDEKIEERKNNNRNHFKDLADLLDISISPNISDEELIRFLDKYFVK
jgi:hypothetical protein